MACYEGISGGRPLITYHAEELTGPRLMPIGRPVCVAGWWLAWELGFQGSHHPWLRMAPLGLSFVQTPWLTLHSCFPSGSLEFWYVLGRRWLCDQPPIKTLGMESLICFSGRYYTCVKLRCLMWLHWERTLEGLRLVSSGLWPMYLFPLLISLCIFAL